jgi:hypothetical protein
MGGHVRGDRVSLEQLKDADINRLVRLGALMPVQPEEPPAEHAAEGHAAKEHKAEHPAKE